MREAVRRINADKRAYLHYFIDYHKAKDPEIGTLKPEDIRASRIVVFVVWAWRCLFPPPARGRTAPGPNRLHG